MLMEAWVSQSQERELERPISGPAPRLPWHVQWIETPCSPSKPMAGGRAVLEITREREPALLFTSCSTGHSGRNILPRQHSKAGLGGVGVSEPTPKDMSAGEVAASIAAYYIG